MFVFVFLGSSEIWIDKLKLSYNKVHRGTERGGGKGNGMEVPIEQRATEV